MPSVNQRLVLPPPWRGVCNKGPSFNRPVDSASAMLNWLCSLGTDWKFVTRWGVEPFAVGGTKIVVPGAAAGNNPLIYLGQLNNETLAEADGAIYSITLNNGAGTNGQVYVYQAGVPWTALVGPGITAQTGGCTRVVFDKAGVDYFLFSNGVEPAFKVNRVAGTYAAFAAYPEYYKACMVVADRLVVGNLATSGAEWVDCSSAIDFEAGWNTNMVKLADTPGPIVAMRSMGATQGVIYKRDAIYMCIPQTGPAPFRYELRASGIAGPASEQAVVKLPDGTHIYVGHDGQVYRFDGSTLQPACPLVDFPFATSNFWASKDQLAGCQGIWWEERGEVYFFFPSGNAYGIPDLVYDAGGLMIRYPDMAAFPITFRANYHQIAPSYSYTETVPTVWGFLSHGAFGGGIGQDRRYLGFNRLEWNEFGVGWKYYIGRSKAFGRPNWQDGSWEGVVVTNVKEAAGCHASLSWQEITPAEGSLITPLEIEVKIYPAISAVAGRPGTENMAPNAQIRRWGYPWAATVNQFDALLSSNQHIGGIKTVDAGWSNGCESIMPGLAYGAIASGCNFDGIYNKLELSGAILTFYVGTPGRR